MASSQGRESPAATAGEVGDPFVTDRSGPTYLRHSNFDAEFFALGPGVSAEQAKRVLQAHLKDTDRRMEEAGKLGTALVQQQRELEERLRDVELLESQEQLNPDLRQKLAEIEKDYNEVARESARAFLPRQRVPSNEAAQGSPYAPEGKGGRRSVSPSKFESMATASPTKLSVPNRKVRNQTANRVHDIEFAAEISTSLIAQVRHLQGLLAEREEELREIKLEKAQLELDSEGFQQRLKSLDESEHRYKDENWNLETQIRELMAAQKEAADREKKLNQSLAVLQLEKNSTQRELDEVKDSSARQDEKHSASIKNLEIELGTSRRNAAMLESERFAMQKKVEDLMSQNQELAKALSLQRGRTSEREPGYGMSDEEFETTDDHRTPDHSPPPSPTKATPRHSMLESETLKTSLHHAQRMIQSLKNNIHREKTEKLELKRMLQDARDELERTRNDPSAGSKRSRKVDSREFKKSGKVGQLGGARSSTTELLFEDPSWEDQPDDAGLPAAARQAKSTAHAQETGEAFETAHERGTETDDFHTGPEDLSNDDVATETEDSPSRHASEKRSTFMVSQQAGNRRSFHSTASTSNDEDGHVTDMKTPASKQNPKLRARMSCGAGNRRSRQASEEPAFQSSPASLAQSSTSGTPQPAGQSLFAELGELDGSDDDSLAGAATPSRPGFDSVTPGSINGLATSRLPSTAMVNSGTMTEPVTFRERPVSMQSVRGPMHGIRSRPTSTISYNDASAQHDPDMADKLAQFPSPPTSPPYTGYATTPVQPPSQHLTVSHIQTEHIEPHADAEESDDSTHVFSMATIVSECIRPVAEPEAPAPPPVEMSFSFIQAEEVKPCADASVIPPTLSFSLVRSEAIEPQEEPYSKVQPSFSTMLDQHIQPQKGHATALGFSSIRGVDIEPGEDGSAKRNALVMPRDGDWQDEIKRPRTPSANRVESAWGVMKGKMKSRDTDTPFIAEDDTRQSPRESDFNDTPESQRPFQELSGNSHGRTMRKPRVTTVEQSAQTSLTSDAIDEMLKANMQPADTMRSESAAGSSTATVRNNRTHSRGDSVDSMTRGKGRVADVNNDARRPGSAASGRTFANLPPLPANHRQVIEAAKGGSSSGGQGTIGTMGPPVLPASAMKTQGGPQTPGSPKPMSPASANFSSRNGLTPRGFGTADVHSPTRVKPPHSRKSSVSSFASEMDNRFNMYPGVSSFGSRGLEATMDYRMIQAITQTMIGEHLWKYTRKHGRGEMSENRHRRYFWIHPYTRTLYWSDRDPSGADRTELRAKSVPIEAVRVVTDDNPMPPGLHRKSLVVVAPGRSVKFTCTTGQRHEIWFNALSYLLLRNEGDGQKDAEEMAGGITRDDVAEFNPSYNTRPAYGTRAAPSLSSYHSRTTRNESPAAGLSMNVPTLTPKKRTSSKNRPSMGTLSRISGIWRDGKVMSGTFGSLRSRSGFSGPQSDIYEANQVHDSAEDLREIIEQQDRAADRLENVRACCDGRHDVGTLGFSSKRGRHQSSGHSHDGHHHSSHLAGPSTPGTVRSRA